MKSKTSFFNKTIFKKNMTLFSPLWAGYLVFLSIMVPGRLWKNLRKIKLNPDWYSEDSLYRTLSDILGTGMLLFGIVVMAALTIMGIYHYLCVSKNTNMIHSLPVTRTELYLTNIVSGLMICWGPQIIVTVLSEIICIRYGYHYEKELFLWLLYGMGTTVIFQSIATLCAMLTGLWIAMPIYYGIANGLVAGITSLIAFIISGFAYGVDYYEELMSGAFVWWMTPIYNIAAHCSVSLVQPKDMMVTGISFDGGKILGIYIVAAIGIYALGWVAYQKRALECAGDLAAFNFLKPILRWGVGFGGGYLCTIFIETILLEIGDNCSWVTFLLLELFFAVVFYFLMEMFIQKRMKIWKSGWTKPLIAFLLFMAVSYGGMYGFGAHIEKTVPKIENIERAYIDQNRCVEYTGNDIAEVIELQKELVARKNYSGYNMNGWVEITYLMKDGKSIKRYYTYPIREEYRSIIEKIDEKENLPENVALEALCYNYKEQLTPRSVKFEGFTDYYYMVNGVKTKNPKPVNWPDGFATSEETKRVYEAFLKDIEEGNYGKDDQYQYDYETGTMFAEEEYDGKGFWMYMDFDVADLDHYQSMQMRKQNEIYYRGEGSYGYSDRNVIEFSDLKNRARVQKEFYITQNCTNVIEAIEELSMK